MLNKNYRGIGRITAIMSCLGDFLTKSFLPTLFLVLAFLLVTNHVYAGHPLTTDDAGTMGKGRFDIEAHSKFIFDKRSDNGSEIKTKAGEFSLVFPYGLIDDIDVALTIPYQWGRVKVDGITTYDEKGLSDFTIETKWRFYKSDNGLSLAIKPSITLPVGDDKKGLGVGKATYGLLFIATKEIQSCAFHLNLGYTYNDNKIDERKDIWKVSAATEVEVMKGLKVVADIGIEK
ncbi:MAG: transporter, partial [Thermodesulfovibrionales bacterium]|nr:transporter [Thermodesulfovibrionales bacterium]